ncbi:MAG: MBL fold metallo-hydrolase [Gammaproteobacteria bacterium]|nr:MBL fold metallo-hydrolase [Gammaproteobacteria bacterium]
MDIQFLGATGEVTGSCHLLTVRGQRILLDCGLLQGARKDEARNREPFPFDPRAIDAVVLSHSHIDHSGRLPLLVKRGYRGPVYTQHAALDLCRIMLRDAAFIAEKDAEWENRKRERKGLEPVTPLYDRRDAERAMSRFEGLAYGTPLEILPGVTLTLHDAGHILGSAIVELCLHENGEERRLVFSGDLGHRGAEILRDPARLTQADLVVLESTYGDRLHRSHDETLREMHDVLDQARRSHGHVLIPAFAVGRTQDLLYLLGKYRAAWGVDHWPIYLDSPLAIEATEIYLRHTELYDDEARARFQAERHLVDLPNLHFSRTAQQSMALNRLKQAAIIIAGSGMCNGGRIRHHLKHNAWRHDCHIVIVGFQARGTLGRQLVDGARHIRLWGETIRVAAHVHTLGGFSAHADQHGLVEWYRHFRGAPPVVLVHGEPDAQATLAAKLTDDAGARDVRIAAYAERVDLARL